MKPDAKSDQQQRQGIAFFGTQPYFPGFGVAELASLVVDIFQTGERNGLFTPTVRSSFKGAQIRVTHFFTRP
jgi:hypothetical protein